MMSRLPLRLQLDLHYSIPPFPRGREAALDGHVLSLVTVLSDDRNDRPSSETETVLSKTTTVLSDDSSLQLRCIGVQLNRT